MIRNIITDMKNKIIENKGGMSHGARLFAWCEDKVESYVYTGRAGLPKGSNLPLTPKKYKAALLSLFSDKVYNLSEIAKEAGVSYGTLLKWRTEERFKKQIEVNIEGYSVVFINELLKARAENSFDDFSILGDDFHFYSLDLIKDILARSAGEFKIESGSSPMLLLTEASLQVLKDSYPSKKNLILELRIALMRGILIKQNLGIKKINKLNLFPTDTADKSYWIYRSIEVCNEIALDLISEYAFDMKKGDEYR
jgi:hypothetical protein